jgi:hypothetical protein
MKKVLFSSVVLFLCISVTKAQHVEFGLKGGLNLSKVSINDGRDYDTKAGAHFGGLAHIHLTKMFALQPELVYSLQGGKDGDNTLKLNYVNMPVLGQFMFGNGFRLQTGPQLGILAVAKSNVGDLDVDVKDDLKAIDFSWVFGASYIFPAGVGFDARFNVGASNISDSRAFDAHNQVFQLGVFYQFKHH